MERDRAVEVKHAARVQAAHAPTREWYAHSLRLFEIAFHPDTNDTLQISRCIVVSNVVAFENTVNHTN